MSISVTLIKSDDWQGLYIDGDLYIQGHRIDLEDIISLFPGIDFKSRDINSGEWTHLPKNLCDIGRLK